MTIDELLERYKAETPDIREHLDTLTNLAAEVEHVTEFGFRYGASFCALLKGKPSTLVTYDININPIHMDLIRSVRPEETEIEFNQISTLDAVIDPTDLLFIDTWHCYSQLKRELDLHGHKAKKYIVMHDTQTYRHKGEDGTTPGLYDAIQEYIVDKPWVIHFDHQNNNGLLCLVRK